MYCLCVWVRAFLSAFVFLFQVFPYSNPAETYRYYSLPFCRPAEYKKEVQQFGEQLVGNRKASVFFGGEAFFFVVALS